MPNLYWPWDSLEAVNRKETKFIYDINAKFSKILICSGLYWRHLLFFKLYKTELVFWENDIVYIGGLWQTDA